MLTGYSVFVVYTTLDPDVKRPDGHIASCWHRTQSCIYYQFTGEIINTSKVTNLWVKCLEKIVNCYPQSNVSDGIEQLASLFLVLYLTLCPQWSAFGKPWSATDDAAEATDDCFTFLLFNQEHSVNNERSASPPFQTDKPHVAPPKRPYCVKTKVFLMYSMWSSIYYLLWACAKRWYTEVGHL